MVDEANRSVCGWFVFQVVWHGKVFDLRNALSMAYLLACLGECRCPRSPAQ